MFGLPLKFLYNDLPRDVNPSKYISVLAQLAVIGECSLGPLCLFLPSVGVPLALAFHTYILSMTPFASVMEWNCYCIFMVLALFSSGGVDPGFTGYTIQSFGAALASFDKPLAAFLLLVLLIVPVYGQIQPKNVPFLTAFGRMLATGASRYCRQQGHRETPQAQVSGGRLHQRERANALGRQPALLRSV